MATLDQNANRFTARACAVLVAACLATGCAGGPNTAGYLAGQALYGPQALSNANVASGNNARAQEAVSDCAGLLASCAAAAPFCAAVDAQAAEAQTAAADAQALADQVAGLVEQVNDLRAFNELLGAQRNRYAEDYRQAYNDMVRIHRRMTVGEALDIAGDYVFEGGRMLSAYGGAAQELRGFDLAAVTAMGGDADALAGLIADFDAQVETLADNLAEARVAEFPIPDGMDYPRDVPRPGDADYDPENPPPAAWGPQIMDLDDPDVFMARVSDTIDLVGGPIFRARRLLDDIRDAFDDMVGNGNDRLRSIAATTANLADDGYASAVEAQRQLWLAADACDAPLPESLADISNPFDDPWSITSWDETFWDFSSP